ncbi:DNA cytosine methyltransferase [Streptomyces sp. NPDC057620]|uniref:DNA cytosine methyltransferase n=1 Tax=Streptomyces sp. NPDC057620 TaxID=3346185 RepID=UPI0036CC5C9B
MTEKAVSLFAGPGGLDLGSEAAGVSTVGIEVDAGAVATRLAAGLATVHDDVRRYGPADFPEARVVTAGPPCQTFTVAGRGEGRLALTQLVRRAKFMAARESLPGSVLDERSLLVLEPLRWILEAIDLGDPYRAVVLEQVPQALPMWQTYADLLRAEGYAVACGLLRTEQYEVAQTRKRAVLLARFGAGDVTLPAPTRGKWSRTRRDPELPAALSMGEVLDRDTPFTVISNYGTGGDPRNRGRRHSTEPAFTVTGKVSRNRVVDADEGELPRFSHSEAGVLQSFPADFPWTGSDIAQQIGNACPPRLGRALVEAVAR